jgi:hypothetical protein
LRNKGSWPYRLYKLGLVHVRSADLKIRLGGLDPATSFADGVGEVACSAKLLGAVGSNKAGTARDYLRQLSTPADIRSMMAHAVLPPFCAMTPDEAAALAGAK